MVQYNQELDMTVSSLKCLFPSRISYKVDLIAVTVFERTLVLLENKLSAFLVGGFATMIRSMTFACSLGPR